MQCPPNRALAPHQLVLLEVVTEPKMVAKTSCSEKNGSRGRGERLGRLPSQLPAYHTHGLSPNHLQQRAAGAAPTRSSLGEQVSSWCAAWAREALGKAAARAASALNPSGKCHRQKW